MLKTRNTPANIISNLSNQIQDLEDTIQIAKEALKEYQTAQATLSSYLEELKNQKSKTETLLSQKQVAETTLTQKQLTLAEVKAIRDQAVINLASTQAALENAQSNLANNDAALTSQTSAKNEANRTFTTRQEQYDRAASSLEAAQQTFNEASSTADAAQAQLDAANQTLNEAQQELDAAQYNYDTNLIPDPDWTAPTQQVERTRQVPHTEIIEHTTTTFEEQVIPNLLFNSDFSRGTEGWSGVNSGWQGSTPGMYDGQITFSYTNQTVSQGLFSGPFQNATLTLSADWYSDWTADSYSMTVTAKDINQNPVGTATYTNTRTSHGWTNRSVTLTATGPVSYITVSFSGIDHGFWYGMYGPQMKNPSLRVSHGVTTTQTTYEEVTTYTTETYYTTEPVLTQGTLNVKINEGGQATFNAPAGAVFVSSNLRYEAIARPTCGKDIAPQLTGLSTITIQALNSVWGDPCGGWQKHITGTISYLGQPTAPLINDASLLPILQEKQAALDVAQQAKDTAQEVYDDKLFIKQLANNDLTSSRETFNEALASRSAAESQVSEAMAAYNEAVAAKEIAQASYDAALTSKQVASSTVETATTNQEAVVAEVTAAETSYEQVSTNYTASTQALAETEEKVVVATKKEASTLEVANKTYTEASKKATTTSNEVKSVPEEGSTDLPAEVTAENLLETDLTQVDPTEMTPEQAEQLKEAALEVFETAEEGSEAYEQALDALYLAAEQDDIVLDPSLAAIPGLTAATELVNFFGNAGSDMSPKTREESEKVVVTAVVAAGAAIQSAAAAASTASAGASSSGGSRRIGK